MRPSKKLSRDFKVPCTALLIVVSMVTNLFCCVDSGLAKTQESTREVEQQQGTLDLSITPTKVPKTVDVDLPEATPLAPNRVAELLRRLPELDAPMKSEMRLPEQSIVRPEIPGKKVIEKFPPEVKETTESFEDKNKAKEKNSQPLRLERISHRGSVDVVEEFSVTFSQPMVPLASAKSIDASRFISLAPQPEGLWMWADTQTLLFHPKKGRFEKGTVYQVEIPDTVTSNSGNRLERTERFTIETPTPRVLSFYPQDKTQSTSPVMIAIFDQKISTEKLLPLIRLTAGDKTYGVRMVEKNSLSKIERFKNVVPKLTDGYWIAVEPIEPLPKGTKFSVSFEEGAFSAEGPLKSSIRRKFTFETHGPMRLRSPRPKNLLACPNRLSFSFTNPIDASTFDPNKISVSPKVKGSKIESNRDLVSIKGVLLPKVTYTIKFDKSIKDIFGQELQPPREVRVTTGTLPVVLKMSSHFITIPKGKRPLVPIRMEGADEVEVAVYSVTPQDWLKFESRSQKEVRDLGFPALMKDVHKVPVNGKIGIVDLSKFLKAKTGHFIIEARTPKLKQPHYRQISTWVQVTDIGLDSFTSESQLVRASSLAKGTPIADVKLTLLKDGSTKITNSRGLAEFPSHAPSDRQELLIADKKLDSAVLPISFRNYESPRIRWYHVTDRSLYRPGESVHVKGLIRTLNYSKKDALSISKPDREVVYFKTTDASGKQIALGETPVDKAGGFSFSIKLPTAVNLGTAYINVSDSPLSEAQESAVAARRTKEASESNLNFMIEEFRRPDFEMKIKSTKGSSLLLGDSTTIVSKASYFGGGPLPKAQVDWAIHTALGYFRPPGWDTFSFNLNNSRSFAKSLHKLQSTRTLGSQTDGRGETALQAEFKDLPIKQPLSCRIEATVTDINRQQWSESTALLVHPSSAYAGLALKRRVLSPEDKISLKTVVSDTEGKQLSNLPIELKVFRRIEESKPGTDEWRSPKSQKITLELVSSQSLKSTGSVLTTDIGHLEPGIYTVLAKVTDLEGRENQSALDIRVPKQVTKVADHKNSSITTTADKRSYKPGDKAIIRVASPVYPLNGLMLLRRKNIIEARQIQIDKQVCSFEIPIKEDYYPNLTVQFWLTGANASQYRSHLYLEIPPKNKELKLSVNPRRELNIPGEETFLDVSLKDAKGDPISKGQVAVCVIDESLLALSPHTWADPTRTFYERAHIYWGDQHLRNTVKGKLEIRRRVDDLASAGPFGSNMFQVEPTVLDERHYTSGRAERHQQSMPIDKSLKIRKNFSSLALFKSAVSTDDAGKATIKIRLPDSISRYRILAIAAAGTDRFGASESTMVTRKPLVVRPSPPRFMNFGDACELPFVIQNETDEAKYVEFAMRATNARVADSIRDLNAISTSTDERLNPNSHLIATAGRRVDIPPHHRAELRIPITPISSKYGSIRFQCLVSSDEGYDAAELEFPIMRSASIESVATYGQVDEGSAVQLLVPPKDVFDEIGGLSVSTSSTQLEALTDAIFYLTDYQFNCSEQISARIIAMVSLENLLTDFGKLKGADKSRFRNTVKKDLVELLKRQREDGSFGLWSTDEDYRWSYVSTQAAQALFLAEEKDYAVPEANIQKCKSYLKEMPGHASYGTNDIKAQRALMARALYLRFLQGDIDSEFAMGLIDDAIAECSSDTPGATIYEENLKRIPADRLLERLPLECIAWLLPVVSNTSSSNVKVDMLRRAMNSQIKETASTASTESEGYGDYDYYMFYSARRTDAVILESLIETDPESRLIPKLVKGLLADRKNGKWDGTQENGYILKSLAKYFEKYEGTTPTFSVKEWLGKTFIGEQTFIGRSTTTHEVKIPMSYLGKLKETQLLLKKEGKGRLYYRVGLDYAEKNLALKPLDRGFSVERTYEAVDDEKDVYKDKDGTWHFKAGATIRTTVKFQNPGNRYHVAMTDPLPAGTEAINASLRGGRSNVPGGSYVNGTSRRHVNYHGRFSDDPHSYTPLSALRSGIYKAASLESGFEEVNYGDQYWWHTWYDHKNLRDHQAEAFRALLRPGVYDYSYLIRATTPGDYFAPPAKLQEMYMQETFGRSASEHVIVE